VLSVAGFLVITVLFPGSGGFILRRRKGGIPLPEPLLFNLRIKSVKRCTARVYCYGHRMYVPGMYRLGTPTWRHREAYIRVGYTYQGGTGGI